MTLERGFKIKLPKPLVSKTIKQIEIIPKPRAFHAVFVYEDPTPVPQVPATNHVLAIDLGLNNLATCVTNGVIPPLIIDGRRLKSINAYYHKRKAKLQTQLARQGLKRSRRLQRLTDWRNAAVTDYLHRASHQVVTTCVNHDIATVVVGDITQSLKRIELGKRTNQNFVNHSLGQFIEQLRYKLGSYGITLQVTDESYTSKASFVDGDTLPKKYNPQRKQPLTFSGKRIKRGLYRSQAGTLVNADVNGAYNILRKAVPKFSFAKLTKAVGSRVKEWLHPSQKIRFLKQKTHQPYCHFKRKKSKPSQSIRRGDKGLILPS